MYHLPADEYFCLFGKEYFIYYMVHLDSDYFDLNMLQANKVDKNLFERFVYYILHLCFVDPLYTKRKK